MSDWTENVELHERQHTDDDGLPRELDARDVAQCGACLRKWCYTCHPCPSARCPFEYEHDDDKQECGRCGDDVYTLSSDGLCDGCVTEDDSRPTLQDEAERLLSYWERHGNNPEVVEKWAVQDTLGILRFIVEQDA